MILLCLALLLLVFLVFRLFFPFAVIALLLAIDFSGVELFIDPSRLLAITFVILVVIGGYYLASHLVDDFIIDGSNKYQGFALPLFVLFSYSLISSSFFISIYNFFIKKTEVSTSLDLVELLRALALSNLSSLQAILWAVALVMLFISMIELATHWVLKNYQIKCSLAQFRTVIFLFFLLNFSEKIINV